MAKYSVDGCVLNTELAAEQWKEATWWDGHNHISSATGSQWDHETLYRSAKGRYWVARTSQWEGSHDRAEILDEPEAARWLLAQDHELPEDLAKYREEIEE